MNEAANLAHIAEELRKLREHLASLVTKDAERIDAADARQALSDVTAAYFLLGQLVEVHEIQKGQMEQLILQITTSLETAAEERSDIKDTLTQVVSLLRKLVRSQEDLARSVGGGDGAPATKRRRATRQK